jgi:hypothetical protein
MEVNRGSAHDRNSFHHNHLRSTRFNIALQSGACPGSECPRDQEHSECPSSGISFTYDFQNRMLMKGALIMVYDGDDDWVSETVGAPLRST